MTNSRSPIGILAMVCGVLFLPTIGHATSPSPDILNQTERLWLTQNQNRLVLAVETSYAPFVFLGPKGDITGLAQDHMQLLEDKLGVHFKQKQFTSLTDAMADIKNGQVQLINAVTATPGRAQFLSFTEPIISVPNVIIVRKERTGQISQDDLAGLKVSLIQSYAITESLTKKNLVQLARLVPDDLAALLDVSFGSSDAAVLDLATASYLIQHKAITNLRAVGQVRQGIELAIGSSKNEPELSSILQKGLAAITDAERQAIRDKWINYSDKSIFLDKRVWTLIAGTFLIVLIGSGGVFAWNRALRQKVAIKTKALAHSNSSLIANQSMLHQVLDTASVAIFLVDERGKIQRANERMLEMFGMSSESLIGCDYCALVHPKEHDLAQRNLTAFLAGEIQVVDIERLYLRADQTEFWGHLTCKGTVVAADGTKALVCVVSDISARKHAERTQRESEDRFRTAFLTSPDAINITRLCDGLYLEVNDGFLQMLGLTREESVGRTSVNLNIWHNPDDRLRLVNALKNTGHCNNLEAVFVAKNGRLMTGSMSAHVIVLQGEECVLTVTRDITERQIAMDQLRKLSQAVEQSTDSIFITNMDAKIEYVNNALLNKTGYPREEVIGENPSIFQSGQTPKETYTELWQSMTQGLVWRGEFFNQRKDGSLYIESAVVSPIRAPDGIITHYVAVKTDITTQKQALERINNLAFYDPLTGLPNRRLLMDRLEQVLATSARHHRHGGLLFVDLDEFKTINETLGHASGDMLLKQVATSLSACLREGDTVARIGGDEFVVLLENLSENELEAATQVESVAENIVTALNHDQKIDNAFYRCTASIGITLFAEHKQTIDDLLKRGELAMYQAKESGRNTLCFFDPEMQTVVMNRVILEADLRDALGDKQFFLCYQAQVRSPSILTGVEALIRWQHPQRGLVSPAEFIPVTEATGLIVPIGRWVLETACLQLSAWALDATMEHLTIAVNVSAKQFHRADFVEDVVAILKRTGARAKRLKLELTESLLVSNIEGVIVKMNALKAIGIGFSLDDFGTGYSSLSYLKRLPLDQLKIDQSFVRDILVDANDAAISKMVIALASTMGLAVIAEGVETEEQRDALIQLGCNAYQGYLYSKPLPVDEFETLVRSQSLQMNFT